MIHVKYLGRLTALNSNTNKAFSVFKKNPSSSHLILFKRLWVRWKWKTRYLCIWFTSGKKLSVQAIADGITLDAKVALFDIVWVSDPDWSTPFSYFSSQLAVLSIRVKKNQFYFTYKKEIINLRWRLLLFLIITIMITTQISNVSVAIMNGVAVAWQNTICF
jgi:hypothetical protein